jgi:hypothetical protein
MAEEVKIVDVAGGPAAEATLQELLKVTKGMAAKAGKDSVGVENKTQKLYNKAVTEGTTTKRGFIKEVKEGTSALKGMTSVIGGLAKGVFGVFTSIIGFGIGVATNLFKAFGDGTGTLTDMVSQIPIFGSLLGSLTGIFDDTLKTFQGLSTSGASFNNNLTELRVAAAGAKVSLDSFASLVGSNTEKFAAFGGTVTQGAQNFVKVRKAMGAYEQQLLGMGLSFEEINEGLMDYMSLQRAGSRVSTQSVEETAAASARYTQNLMTLSKLTGQDIKSQREKIAQASIDVAYQMKLARMEPKEREKTQKAMAEAMAAGGETGALFFKQQILEMAPLTRATKLFATTMPGAAAAIKSMADQAQNTGVSMEQFEAGQIDRLANFVEGAAAAGRDLETLLAASASGLEGPGAEIATILQGMGKQFTDYMEKDGSFNKEKLKTDLLKAKNENNKRDDLVKGLTDFQSTLRSFKETIELYIIGPIGKVMGPEILKLSEYFKTASEGIGKKTEEFMEYFKTKEFKEDLEKFKTSIVKMKDAVVDFIKDIRDFGFSGAVAKMLSGGTTTEIGEAISGIVGKAMGSLLTSIGEGLLSLFSNPKVIAGLVAAIGGLFLLGKAKSGLASMLGGKPGGVPGSPGSSTGGKAGSNIGGMLGGIGGGIIEGIAKGLAAAGAKAPLVILGAGAIGSAITLIGAGIAGAAWLTGKALPTFTEGVKSFETLDGKKLGEVGFGMIKLAAGMAAFGGGSAVGGIGNLVGDIAGSVGKLFGGEDPMTKLQRFSEYNINAARVKNNAEALVAFSKAMATSGGAGAASGIGAAAGAIGNAIAGFFGGNKGLPYDEIIKFSSYSFDTTKIKTNAEALVAFNRALSASAGAQAVSGGGSAIASIGNAISKFFGGETPFEQVKAFGDLKLNAEGVRNNATAMTAMYTALGKMSSSGSLKDVEIPKALVSRIKELSDITGGGLPTVAAGMEAIGKVQGFKTNLDVLKNGLDVKSVTSYTDAMGKLVDTLGKLNKVLAEDNKGMFGKGSGVAAADVVKTGGLGGKSSEDQLQKLDQLNTTMVQVLATLQEGNEYGKRTSKAIRANGNLQLGV